MLEVLADDVALFSRWELCMAAVGADGVVDELEFSDEGAELGLEGIVGTVCCVVVVGRQARCRPSHVCRSTCTGRSADLNNANLQRKFLPNFF